MFLVDILKSDCILDKGFDVQIKKLEVDNSIIVKGDFEIFSCVFGEAAWYLEYAILLLPRQMADSIGWKIRPEFIPMIVVYSIAFVVSFF